MDDEHEKTCSNTLKLLRYLNLKENNVVNNRMTLMRWVKSGDFPQPIRIGKNSIAWRESDVEAWLERRARETA
jgi:prophage regulatory protein